MRHFVAQKLEVFFGKTFEDFGSTCNDFHKFLVFILTKCLLEGLDPGVDCLLGMSSQILAEQHTVPETFRVDTIVNNVIFHHKRQGCLLLLKNATTLGRLGAVGTLAVASLFSFKLGAKIQSPACQDSKTMTCSKQKVRADLKETLLGLEPCEP